MRRTLILTIIIATGVLALGACTSGNTGGGGGTPQAGAPRASAAQGSASPGGASPTAPTQTATGQLAATTLDPCALVTSAEASQVAGTSYGKGKESKPGEGLALCIYGSNTKNVFEVAVVQAPDAATIQQGFNEAVAQFKQTGSGEGVTATTDTVSGVGDTAKFVTFHSAVNIGGSAIFLVKGSVFVDISDIVGAGAIPSEAALVTEGKLVVSRLP